MNEISKMKNEIREHKKAIIENAELILEIDLESLELSEKPNHTIMQMLRKQNEILSTVISDLKKQIERILND